MKICFLGLGSNIGDPTRQLRSGIAHLKKIPRTRYIQQSSIHKTIPHGVSYQPLYLNMVVQIRTALSPQALLKYCLAIEKKQQRTRRKPKGSRTLDIDLLLYGNHRIKTPTLTLPHPELLNRRFVLDPLNELCDWQHKHSPSILTASEVL